LDVEPEAAKFTLRGIFPVLILNIIISAIKKPRAEIIIKVFLLT
jgi:hypothetical protein